MTEETQTSQRTVQSPPKEPLTVMLLGAGELSGELVIAFQRLGAVVIAVDRNADAPARAVADRAAVVKMTDPDELIALIEREQPDFVVAEAGDNAGNPVIANDALTAISERGLADVVPTPRSARLTVDREGLRRLAADELGLPTAPFWFAGSVEELTAVAHHAGFPLVVRPVTGAQGEGQSVLLRPEDIEPAWERAVAAGGRVAAATRVMAETMVEIDYEVTLLTVRSAGPSTAQERSEPGSSTGGQDPGIGTGGQERSDPGIGIGAQERSDAEISTGARVQFCEPIGHRQLDGDVLECWQPQIMTPAAIEAAKSIAARIVNALGGRGIYGVELLIKGDEVYFADVATYPYDTGLVTLRSQRLSEFELHARAVLGLPVDTIMVTPGASELVYGGTDSGTDTGSDDEERTERVTRALSDALAVPESDVRVFGYPQSHPQRRLGVALATAADVTTARERVRQVAAALRKFW